MSGHSKWSTIKRQKEASDKKRGAIFSKLSKAITIAARNGGDPDMNFSLRLAMDKAKAANMPKDNIERAIKKGTGEGDGARIEEITYEAYGPEGIGYVIQALTDNRNRTAASLKSTFSKHGGSLAGPNSVMWMFDRKAVLRVPLTGDRDEQELAVIESGAQDMKEEEGALTVHADPADLQAVKESLEEAGQAVEYAELEYVPKEPKRVDPDMGAKLEKLHDELDEDEDVDSFFTNAEIE